jgi:regulator of RNase E activity RraB
VQHDFPNDAHGDALRRLLDDGSDFSKPMSIDFQIAVPDEAAANGLAEMVYKLGYRVKIYASPECSLPWTCECSTRMLVSYDGVLAIQTELATLAMPFRGYPDGWGSFGNNANETPATG